MAALVEEMNRRNLAHLFRASEVGELGKVISQVLAETYGRGRAETILHDALEAMKR